MKLMYSPGACSIGIHVLLEEIGKPYEAQLVNLREGAQFKPDFTAVNPKSKVPTLVRDDGSVLTEYPAIAFWLASTNPEKKLLPEDVESRTRGIEALDYAVATIHMQGPACGSWRPHSRAPRCRVSGSPHPRAAASSPDWCSRARRRSPDTR